MLIIASKTMQQSEQQKPVLIYLLFMQKLRAQPKWTPVNDQYRSIASGPFANWHAFFQYHVLCLSHLIQNQHTDAYEASRAALQQFSTVSPRDFKTPSDLLVDLTQQTN